MSSRSIGVTMRIAGTAALLLCTSASSLRADTDSPVEALKAWLSRPATERPPLAEQPFATNPLSREQAELVRSMLVDDWRDSIRRDRSEEFERKVITIGKQSMKFFYKIFGDKPAGGRSLYISMHGGGGAPAVVNDQQWENQKRLYQLKEGVYVAPRAPTDNWNLWHEAHIDALFDRLVEDMIVFEEVDPDRVYILGYSAGGDGVYQLAPRWADRLAAASTMAGHPNEAQPLGLRNIGFAIHVGALDNGYDRNKVAQEWKEQLDKLQKDDPSGYRHLVELHAGKAHWMDREDASAIDWLHEFKRDPYPRRIVWRQDDVTHSRFYWLAVDSTDEKKDAEVVADLKGQEINIQTADVVELTIRVNDQMLDMDQPVTVRASDEVLFDGVIPRTIEVIAQTLAERGDPKSLYDGEMFVRITEE
jgi:hypothetical protein